MAKILVLQHHPADSLGTIAEALEGAALAWQYVRIFQGHRVPTDMKGTGGLIVLGGPMGVYETGKYPYLAEEMKLIETAIAEHRPVLGICLGSQLIAAALGAKVTPGARKEIGWHRVDLSPEASSDRLLRGIPPSFMGFHWHGDVFDLPRGAVALASSELTAVQAFRHGEKTYGFLFHPETSEETVHSMIQEFAGELDEVKMTRAEIIAGADTYLEKLAPIADTIFSRWARPIQGT